MPPKEQMRTENRRKKVIAVLENRREAQRDTRKQRSFCASPQNREELL